MTEPEHRESRAATTDEQHLIALLQSGDPATFERIFREYAAALGRLSFSYVRSRDTAEEIVQDLFTWLWTNRHSFAPTHGVRAYLFGAVRNRSLNALRDDATATRAAARSTHHTTLPSIAADADLMASDLAAVVNATVESMPPRCREVFTLVRTQSLTYAEVAVILGIAPKTVEVHMGRALALLRVQLGPWLNG